MSRTSAPPGTGVRNVGELPAPSTLGDANSPEQRLLLHSSEAAGGETTVSSEPWRIKTGTAIDARRFGGMGVRLAQLSMWIMPCEECPAPSGNRCRKSDQSGLERPSASSQRSFKAAVCSSLRMRALSRPPKKYCIAAVAPSGARAPVLSPLPSLFDKSNGKS